MEIITTHDAWSAHPWTTIKEAVADPIIKEILRLGYEIRFTPNIVEFDPCGFFVQLWDGQPGLFSSSYIGLLSAEMIKSEPLTPKAEQFAEEAMSDFRSAMERAREIERQAGIGGEK